MPTRRGARLTVKLDRFARPVTLTLEGQLRTVVQACERTDLEQGFYGALPTQVWEVMLDDGQGLLLVRSLIWGNWTRPHRPLRFT